MYRNVALCFTYLIISLLNDTVQSLPTIGTRIVGGEKVTNRSEFPYQVSLRYVNKHMCGGTIIDENNVLTASHCCFNEKNLLSASKLSVVVGDLDLKKPTNYTVTRNVKYIFTHSGYDRNTLSNDIAVLRLEKSLGKWNSMVKPMTLSNSLPQANTPCKISGWGKLSFNMPGTSNELYYAIVPLMEDSVCKAMYNRSNIKKGMFCAGYSEGKIDSCQGDSGGPLVCGLPGNETLVGVVSWGYECAVARKPGVYTDVSMYKDWILEQVQRSSSHVCSTSLTVLSLIAVLNFFYS